MRILRLFLILGSVGLGAFSLAISGLGPVGNAVVFALAASGLLFSTVNLTSAKRAAQLAKKENAAAQTGAHPLADNAQ